MSDREHIDTGKNEDSEKTGGLSAKNKAAALSLAVMLTLSTALTGCASGQKQGDDEDDSYYTSGGGGGSYYYSPGGSYKIGSWGKSYSYSGSSGYSSARGGSIGG